MRKQNTVDWQSKPIARIIQKIREALIHKRKRNGEFQPLNWFHILTCRVRWLVRSEPNGWWWNVKNFIDSYQPDCIRYYTDMSFRLDKKIEKVMDQYVAETAWIDSYSLEYDCEYGNSYRFTLVYYKEEQSEEVYSKWVRDLENKLFDITETERLFKLACVYVCDFIHTYLTAEDGQKNIHFCGLWQKELNEEQDGGSDE